MDKEIVNRITSEIKRSGFPLEIYCLNVCSKKNTGRMPNIRYQCEEGVKEIDLYAFFEEINLTPKKGDNRQYTSTAVIIECKKSKYPWVFFSSKQYAGGPAFCFAKYYSDFDYYFDRIGAPHLGAQIFKKLKKNHYVDNKNVPHCLSYFEAFRKPDAPSEIYKAIESVLSFLNFKIESRKSRAKNSEDYTQFYYPVIVLEGVLFEAEIGEDVHVEKKDYIQLRVDYKDDIYIVDVVTKDNFENLFSLIEADHYEFVKSINDINFSEEYQSSLKSKTDDFLDMYFAEY
jgi:hypothetical protein